MCPRSHVLYQYRHEIPDHCEILGMTFYHPNSKEIINTITQYKSRCDQLLVILNEPPDDVVDLVRSCNHPTTVFFSDFVPHQPLPGYHTAINWFISANNPYAIEAWAQKLLHNVVMGGSKPFVFDCLLGSRRDERDLIHSWIQASDYKDRIYCTYYGDRISDGDWEFDIGSSTQSGDRVAISGGQSHICNVLPVEIYNKSHCSIVSETMHDNAFARFTEKTAKPIMTQRPFVAFAGQYFLRACRDLGFQTFDPVIDESYDEVADCFQRWNLAWQQVQALCDRDPQDTLSMLRPVVCHNRRHFFATDWHESIRQYLE